MANVLKMHENDPNFSHVILERVKYFLSKVTSSASAPLWLTTHP